VDPAVDKEPNQGGFVQTRDGRWWFFTHQGRGDWEGRAAVLLPVTWVDGWPVPGRVGADGIGSMVWRGAMPVAGEPRTTVAVSDDFNGRELRPEWQWDYQPRSGMWSLTERRGYLRLHAFVPLKPNDPRFAGNVLTQRAFRSSHNEVTVQLDTAGLAPGEQAGLSHFARTDAAITVTATAGGTLFIQADGAGSMPDAIALPEIDLLSGQLRSTLRTVWLRSTWGFDGLSQFSYSRDGTHFTDVGAPYQLTWGNYRGDRIGLFTTGQDAAPHGYADFSRFVYRVAR
jgi:beta-xylosidase